MLNTQRKLSLVEVQYIIVEVLTPTQAGIEKVQTEMDTDKSGNVDKSEAEQWWLRNCSRDLRAFERAWLAVVRFHHVSSRFSCFLTFCSRFLSQDVDCSNDLDFDEIEAMLTGHVQNLPTTPAPRRDSLSSMMSRNSSSLIRELGEGALISNHVASADDQLVAPPVEPLPVASESDSESDAEAVYSRKLINSVNPKGQLGRYSLRIHVREGKNLAAMDRGGTCVELNSTPPCARFCLSLCSPACICR